MTLSSWLLGPFLVYLVYLVYTITAICILLGTLFLYIKPKHVDDSVPGPKRHWLFGTTFEFDPPDDGNDDENKPKSNDKDNSDGGGLNWSKWPEFCLNASRRLQYQTWGAPTLNIGFGGACFVICSPDMLQYILRDNFRNYVKGKVARGCLSELFGAGVFTADGDLWKFHRKVIVSLVTKDMVKHSCTVLLQKLQQVEQYLIQEMDSTGAVATADDSNSESTNSGSSDSSNSIDFQDLCMRLTLDVMVEMAFGVEMDSLVHPNVAFSQAFSDLQSACHDRFNDLFWEWRKRWCWGAREVKIRQSAKVLDDFCFDIIARAQQQQQEQNSAAVGQDHIKERPDLISRFLRHVEMNKEAPPGPRELRDLVMNFALAGRDGTACTMSWAMYELTKHPTVADSIREEVRQVCKNGQDYSYDAIQSLSYTHAVVMETLRLHPPVPDDFKFALRDDVLPDGTRIPAGSLVMYSPYTINQSESVWGPDAADFRPDRFLETGEPSAFKFPSFNAGPRTCPGKPFALIQVKLVLAYLLERFEFVDAKGHDGAYNWTLIMAMKNGFQVNVQRRQ
jgi:cytochrome P450